MDSSSRTKDNKPSELDPFYAKVINELTSKKVLKTDARILVLCAGKTDSTVLQHLGFTNVTMSSISPEREKTGSAVNQAYKWIKEDASSLSLPDNSFDFVIEHSGLHHLPCPQKAITEMYRVASTGILAFEPARNFITSIGVALGFGQEYEVEAVSSNQFALGGLNDTAIPNYVYRFTRSDIVQCLQAFAPIARHKYRFWFATRIPERLLMMDNPIKGAAFRMLAPFIRLAGMTIPCLANNMAFYVAKPSMPEDLLPWLEVREGKIMPRTGGRQNQC